MRGWSGIIYGAVLYALCIGFRSRVDEGSVLQVCNVASLYYFSGQHSWFILKPWKVQKVSLYGMSNVRESELTPVLSGPCPKYPMTSMRVWSPVCLKNTVHRRILTITAIRTTHLSLSWYFWKKHLISFLNGYFNNTLPLFGVCVMCNNIT
jgi:hypothetical protein